MKYFIFFLCLLLLPWASSASDTNFPTKPTDMVILEDKKYFRALMHHLENAKEQIHVGMFLFKTTDSPGNRANILVKELGRAKKRGVDVVVLLEKSGHDRHLNKSNQNTAKKLARENIRVFFDSPTITSHCKVVVIDRRYVFFGSHNFSHSALYYNHEISVLADNNALADKILNYMEKLKN